MCTKLGSRYLMDLEWRICNATNIYVYRNGVEGEDPTLVHIPPSHKQTMEAVMAVVDDRVKFPIGFATALYTMKGQKICHPGELELYHNYVVGSNYDKGFKCIDYSKCRGKFLVLHKDTRHIRALRLLYKDFDQWAAKKKRIVYEGRGLPLQNDYTRKYGRQPLAVFGPGTGGNTCLPELGKCTTSICPINYAKQPELGKCNSSFCPVNFSKNMEKCRPKATRRRRRPRKQEVCYGSSPKYLCPNDFIVNTCSVHTKLNPFSPSSRQSKLCQQYSRETTVRFESATDDANQQYPYGHPPPVVPLPERKSRPKPKVERPGTYVIATHPYPVTREGETSTIALPSPGSGTRTHAACSYTDPGYTCPAFARGGEVEAFQRTQAAHGSHQFSTGNARKKIKAVRRFVSIK